MSLTTEQMVQLTRLVADTEPEELDCDQVLDLLAGYLESKLGHRPELPDFAAAEQHLRVCADCGEEFKALLDACRE